MAVSVKRSREFRNRLLYGPDVEYRDPRPETHVLSAASHQRRWNYGVGDEVTLLRDPSGEVRLPLPRPRSQMALPFILGLSVIVLGVVDLMEG